MVLDSGYVPMVVLPSIEGLGEMTTLDEAAMFLPLPSQVLAAVRPFGWPLSSGVDTRVEKARVAASWDIPGGGCRLFNFVVILDRGGGRVRCACEPEKRCDILLDLLRRPLIRRRVSFPFRCRGCG